MGAKLCKLCIFSLFLWDWGLFVSMHDINQKLPVVQHGKYSRLELLAIAGLIHLLSSTHYTEIYD